MMPTTLGLVGVDVPQHSQGSDFSPLIRGEEFSGPEEVLIEMNINPRWNLDFLDWRGFVTREWKYAFYETGKELLHNLTEDPYELNNLVETQRDRRDEMRKRLLNLLDTTREPYFDVLINHGVHVDRNDIDVSKL
jgi:arylsulfatase A-like enzyme